MTPSPCWQAPRSPASMPPPGSCSGIRTWRWTLSRTRLSGLGVICPRCATRPGSTPGCTDCSIHACTDEIRRAKRHRLDVDIGGLTIEPATADATSTIVDRDELERGFGRLGPEERAVIVLHHFLDLPLAEVASTLQIPLGTVKSRLYRGLKQMRAVLDADARPGPEMREDDPA